MSADALIFDDTHQIEHVPLPHADIEQLSDLASELLSHQPLNASEVQSWSYTSRDFSWYDNPVP